MAGRASVSDLVEEFDALTLHEPSDGQTLYQVSANVNAFWFRNRLPECKAHDTINAIDSEGEDVFLEQGETPAPDTDKAFFDCYFGHYAKAVARLRNVLLDRQGSA